ncbi:hypothetical protein B0T26DRAFT_762096 [Lasiosphaeria miniovina]|uniref:Uncharacterized protein n=1 Tax=Lasiosphaeria miniovina TaxID=1954250 RepID=A0AA40BI67_9PEZI|nr:uncharacterized protein B0T26DRAFT_762096 [Lasiosphaeria miniovina]KAK0734666.1 hypothetical protein B0T26DRAFT_762096 [Lasiosphaeria miniovina]
MLNKPLPPTTQPMAAQVLGEFLDTIDRALSHLRYAVSCDAALAVWGFSERLPTHVGILCPADTRSVIHGWARTSGWHLFERQPDVMGVPTPGGQVRKLRIQYVDADVFDALGRVATAGDGDGDSTEQQTTLGDITRTIFWLLHRIADDGCGDDDVHPKPAALAGLGSIERLAPETAPNMVAERFWIPFTAAHPESLALFERCSHAPLPPSESGPECHDWTSSTVHEVHSRRGSDLSTRPHTTDSSCQRNSTAASTIDSTPSLRRQALSLRLSAVGSADLRSLYKQQQQQQEASSQDGVATRPARDYLCEVQELDGEDNNGTGTTVYKIGEPQIQPTNWFPCQMSHYNQYNQPSDE